MSRLAVIVIAAFLAVGCNDGQSSNAHEAEAPKDLPELLQAHDREVKLHGKDLRYVQPIGGYGRQGVIGALRHLDQAGIAVSSYNATELIFGVATEARVQTGYDICMDAEALVMIRKSNAGTRSPTWQRKQFNDFLKHYCGEQ